MILFARHLTSSAIASLSCSPCAPSLRRTPAKYHQLFIKYHLALLFPEFAEQPSQHVLLPSLHQLKVEVYHMVGMPSLRLLLTHGTSPSMQQVPDMILCTKDSTTNNGSLEEICRSHILCNGGGCEHAFGSPQWHTTHCPLHHGDGN